MWTQPFGQGSLAWPTLLRFTWAPGEAVAGQALGTPASLSTWVEKVPFIRQPSALVVLSHVTGDPSVHQPAGSLINWEEHNSQVHHVFVLARQLFSQKWELGSIMFLCLCWNVYSRLSVNILMKRKSFSFLSFVYQRQLCLVWFHLSQKKPKQKSFFLSLVIAIPE